MLYGQLPDEDFHTEITRAKHSGGTPFGSRHGI